MTERVKTYLLPAAETTAEAPVDEGENPTPPGDNPTDAEAPAEPADAEATEPDAEPPPPPPDPPTTPDGGSRPMPESAYRADEGDDEEEEDEEDAAEKAALAKAAKDALGATGGLLVSGAPIPISNTGKSMRMVPDTGFLRSYLDHYIYRDPDLPITHAPWTFHYASALTVLGAALLENTWIQWGSHLLHPNLFTLLIGSSSIQAKSTSIGAAMGPLRKFRPSLCGPSEMSAEGLLPALAEHPSMLLTFGEFARLLNLTQTWGAGLKSLLMDLYDCPPRYTKRLANKKPLDISAPKVALLGGVNTAVLESTASTIEDWRTGFLARFLPVLPGGPDGENLTILYPIKRIPFPRPVNPLEIDEMARKLGEVASRALPLHAIEPSARTVYIDWLAIHDPKVGELPEHLEPVHNRITVMVLKVAVILQADLGGGAILTEEAMTRACAFGDMAWSSTLALSDAFAESRPMQIRRKVLRVIQRGEDGEQGACFRAILRRAKLLKSEALPILESLEAEDTAKSINHKTADGLRRTAYVLTERGEAEMSAGKKALEKDDEK